MRAQFRRHGVASNSLGLALRPRIILGQQHCGNNLVLPTRSILDRPVTGRGHAHVAALAFVKDESGSSQGPRDEQHTITQRPGAKAKAVATAPSAASHPQASRLDPYLPLELRSKSWLENLSSFEGVRSVTSLPELLHDLRPHFRFGTLAYIALEQQRWPAFLTLANALVKETPREEPQSDKGLQGGSPWNDNKIGTSELGIHERGPVGLGIPGGWWLEKAKSGLEGAKHGSENEGSEDHSFVSPFLVRQEVPTEGFNHSQLYQDALGEVWQALGHIVLRASEGERNEAESMLSYVHQVLSTMHSEERISSQIYQYGRGSCPQIRRKPPFLQLMSSRIMTAISDSMWKANEESKIDTSALMGKAYAESMGFELKDLYPQIRTIQPQVWLDLILWSCVHGNHFSEGASILRDMVARRGDARWRAVNWDELVAETTPEGENQDTAKAIQQRFDRIAGAHEGYSRDPPVVDLPLRTISVEVVAATITGTR